MGDMDTCKHRWADSPSDAGEGIYCVVCGMMITHPSKLQQELKRLRERWLFIKSDPESARHLLLLLSWGKGTGDDFDRMIDRLIASKATAWRAATAEAQEHGDG